MKKIFKFPLEIDDVQPVVIPQAAKILSVQMQHGELCLWAEVQTSLRHETRYIEIIGTGHEIDESHRREYIGTVQTADGNLVWHVYERLAPKP